MFRKRYGSPDRGRRGSPERDARRSRYDSPRDERNRGRDDRDDRSPRYGSYDDRSPRDSRYSSPSGRGDRVDSRYGSPLKRGDREDQSGWREESARGGRGGSGRGEESARGGRGGPGRDFGGRGRGGRGDIRHVGQVQEIERAALNINDQDVLKILESPSVALTKSSKTTSYVPGTAPIEIVANYFKVDKSYVPSKIYHYNITIYKEFLQQQSSTDEKEDLTQKKTERKQCVELVKEALMKVGGIQIPPSKGDIGCAYDGSKILFTTKELPETLKGDVRIAKGSRNVRFLFDNNPFCNVYVQATLTRLQALEIALYSFARWDVTNNPKWFIEKTKAYRSDDQEKKIVGRDQAYAAIKGYVTNLKYNLAGSNYQLIVDLSVSIFVNSGPLTVVMAAIGGFRDEQELIQLSKRGLPSQLLANCLKYLKNSRIEVVHQPGSIKRIKEFGPPADSTESQFSFEGQMITVARYYEKVAELKPEIIEKFLYNGKLKYPSLPVVNTGSLSKPTYIPMELAIVAKGQIKSTMSSNSPANASDVTSEVVKLAAMHPNDRYRYLVDQFSIITEIRKDSTATEFGINNIPPEPITINATLLPPAKLQYNDQIVEPKLMGQWFSKKFFRPAVSEYGRNETLKYGILVITNNLQYQMRDVDQFSSELEREAKNLGLIIKLSDIKGANVDRREIKSQMIDLRQKDAEIIIVIMVGDNYKLVKSVADTIPIMTQCLKFERVKKQPKGYHSNILLKINVKLGGINHVLASRGNSYSSSSSSSSQNTFQYPTNSLPSALNKLTMLIGIDNSGESESDITYHGVVGSMDPSFTKYGAYLSKSVSTGIKNDAAPILSSSIKALFIAFKNQNGNYPENVIIYRDGVSDAEFSRIKNEELKIIKDTIDNENIKVTLVLCQKRHTTRLFYKLENNNFTNMCPGICVDRNVEGDTIVGNYEDYDDFFLNSHSPIQGTCKPCKYIVITNEIGLQLSQIELITYWSTYMYCRTNRSVSYATPAYYAHWASKRAKILADEGFADDLEAISQDWLVPDRTTSMFFA